MAKKIVKNSGLPEHGYFMYKDGTSRWGVGVMKGTERAIRITMPDDEEGKLVKAMHHNPNIDEKLAWYKKESEAKVKTETI